MRRYPAFDPPEYLDWSADPGEVESYARRVSDDPERAEQVERLGEPDLLRLYRDLLRTRLHDIQLKRWVRSGVISKAWLCTGEEAVTVGAVAALDARHDVVCPMIRNAGSLHMMGMPLADMFRGYLGTADSPSGGRDLHVGDPRIGVIQPISHMGTNVPVLAWVALAFRMRREPRVALTWIGDGASRTFEAHEGTNFAAVARLPVVYMLQNNQVALGTRVERHGAGDLRDWPAIYGLPSRVCDGNNVLDVYAATALAAGLCRAGEGPAVVVAETFRMGGHATHDEREARETFDEEQFRSWGKRDPVGLYEAWLLGRGLELSRLEEIEREVIEEMERAAAEARSSSGHMPSPEKALYQGFSEGDALVGLRNRPV